MSENEIDFDLDRIDNSDIFEEELKYHFNNEQLKYLCEKDYLEVAAFKTNALTILEKKIKKDNKIKFNRTLRLHVISYLKIKKNDKFIKKYYIDSYQRFQSTKQKRWEQRKINSLFSLGLLPSTTFLINNPEAVYNTKLQITKENSPDPKQNLKNLEDKENIDENDEGSTDFLPGVEQNYANSKNSEGYLEFDPISVSTQNSVI